MSDERTLLDRYLGWWGIEPFQNGPGFRPVYSFCHGALTGALIFGPLTIAAALISVVVRYVR